MLRPVKSHVWLLLPLLATAAGCPSPTPGPDGGTPGDDGGVPGLASCLEQPGLAHAPTGQLPCELLPPGFKK